MILDYTKGEIKEGLDRSKPLPAGIYPALVKSMEDGVAQSSGNPKVTVTFVIAPEAAKGAGRQVIKDYSMTPTAVWRYNNDMVAIGGVDIDYFDGNAKMDTAVVAKASIGRKCSVELLDPDEGFSNNKLNKVRPRK